MAKLLGIQIRNYRALRDVSLGRLKPSQLKVPELPSLVCLIGPNGSGKSTLLDAFGFLADCLREGIEAACDKPGRGGFRRLRTQGEQASIEFHLCYRDKDDDRPLTYSLIIGESDAGVPIALSEKFEQARKGKRVGKLYPFVELNSGVGTAWAGDSTADSEGTAKVDVQLDDPGRLAIATLGQLKEHHRIQRFREYVEGWYLSYFIPDAARTLPIAGGQKHLNRAGDNLANVVEFMERGPNKARFQGVLDAIAARIPGVKTISTKHSPDNRLLLAFNENGYNDPFYQYSMSDGTLKMFTYLLLMQDPSPRPFIGIEEPENGLYHKLVERLAEELKDHAASTNHNVVVTTHSPYFVDALKPEQVWLVQKDAKGHTTVTRTADMPNVSDLIKEGVPLGSLWYSNHFDERVRT